jgi:hypothetical protein
MAAGNLFAAILFCLAAADSAAAAAAAPLRVLRVKIADEDGAGMDGQGGLFRSGIDPSAARFFLTQYTKMGKIYEITSKLPTKWPQSIRNYF